MESSAYLETLKERFRHRFDICEDADKMELLKVDLLATYSLRDEKHMLTKSITLYAQEEYEHCLVRVFREEVTLLEAQDFAGRICRDMLLMVRPHPDHKRTILTGVLVAEQGCEEAVKDFVAKYRSQKAFRCYLMGWCEVRLVLADLSEGTVVHRANHASRHLERMYRISPAM